MNQDKINEMFIESLYEKIKEYRAWQYQAELRGFLNQAMSFDSLANLTIKIRDEFVDLIGESVDDKEL